MTKIMPGGAAYYSVPLRIRRFCGDCGAEPDEPGESGLATPAVSG
jgi:hypothetical protein